MFDFNPAAIAALLPGVIIAMAVHEYAHALAADSLGDNTPRFMGRLTLNPLAHIDPIGWKGRRGTIWPRSIRLAPLVGR